MSHNNYIDSPDEFSVAPVIMKDAECSLVDNLIAEKLILPTFRLDAPVLLRARVKLSRGTSQFIGSSWSKVAAC